MLQGRLVLVVGTTEALAAAIVDKARRRLYGNEDFVFPRRIITLGRSVGGEVHQAVTPAQYYRMRREGAFSLTWTSDGLSCALPASIAADLTAGRNVVAAVSEQAAKEAQRLFPSVEIVETSDLQAETPLFRPGAKLDASAETLAARLKQETAPAVYVREMGEAPLI